MAKRSRRARKHETEKRLQKSNGDAAVTPAATTAVVETPAAKESTPQPVVERKHKVNFAEEYYYVYTELRNITLIAAAMFVLMFGLGYFI